MPKPTLSYDNVAKTLHWVIALAIIAMLIIGWTMMNISKDNPYRFGLFQWHKSIGITILLLSILRLFWRLTHKAPPLPVHMPVWEKFAAKATHWFFYILIIGMPLAGWALISTSPISLPTLLYGFIPWPDMPVVSTLDNKAGVHHLAVSMHTYGAYVLAALLVLHAGAAHKHHWFDRDDVLTRMAPGPVARLLDRMRG